MHAFVRGMRTGMYRVVAVIAVLCCGISVDVAGQLFGPQTMAFENARILRPDGSFIDNGVLIVRGERILFVGREAPERILNNARRVDLDGRVITPGLIDVTDLIANTSSSGSDASHLASDAFDRYDLDRIHEVLAHGVTAGFVPARGGAGVTGTGAVFRLTPNTAGSYGEALVSSSAICVDLGSGRGAIDRLQIVDGVRKAFRAAIDYREALNVYEDELEAYTEKLAERAKEKKDVDEKKSDENGKQQGRQRGGQGGNGEKKDELKKPSEPRRDPGAEALLKAIDHEIPVRVMARSSEDIFNAIEIAEEFDLKLVIEGATHASQVMDAIAAADADIVFDFFGNDTATPGMLERAIDLNVRAALDANVSFGMGAGRNVDERSRFLLMQAQLASQARDELTPLELLTTHAAAMLGVEEEIGRLEAGRLADFVIWSDDPLAPSARVDEVFVNGRIAFKRDAGDEQDGGASR